MKILGLGNVEQICSRFGLIEDIPIKIYINSDKKNAKLSKSQIELLWSLRKSSNDSIVISNCTKSQIKEILKRTKHQRDIHKIKKIGLLESIIILHFNSDGPGIVYEIGPFIKSKIGVIIGSRKK